MTISLPKLDLLSGQMLTLPGFLILCFTAVIVYRDYKAFKSLGPGGTPSTIPGYVRVKILSLFRLKDPYSPIPVPKGFRPQHGLLSSVQTPRRVGPRPEVDGIAPQRQLTQMCSEDAFASLSSTISEFAAVPSNKLVLGTSCFEKHGTGLFSLAPLTRTCKGEICHAHASDGSLHMTLHPQDAATVLLHGWGERHPLARGGWFSRFVPPGFLMVYAPRTEQELEVVTEIIRAAAWFVSGQTICTSKEEEQRRDSGCVMEEDEGEEEEEKVMEGCPTAHAQMPQMMS
ncbi:hypothetical protein LTR16_000317 [Cryomyces antarcticus]|uniref:Luciferase domain-containing protein n=1 Tax=Cryomyces antarcticus TaxID=329879 RepID=A0ABR0KWN0_9PEZI|nr:hypothetical protein LTR39_000172 [Cryomyces antarcticus]KAK5021167.1 hypothetical protein LTR60_000089 [Cryomyces antarcticus]KAK5131882.1 hypothetical protein LTR16_000317 [Cryomyces antarcticus]